MARNEHLVFLPFDVPPDLERNYVFEVWHLFARSLKVASHKLSPLKLSTRHYAAMAVLASSDRAATQSMLAKRLGLSPNIVVGMVDYLDRLGYTKRRQNPRNRRENIVQLSPKGRKAYGRAVRRLRQAEQELLASLSKEEQRHYMAIIDRLRRSASTQDLSVEFS